jgi:hypothetical protein
MYKYNVLEIKSISDSAFVVSVNTGEVVNYHTLSMDKTVKDLEFLKKEYDGSFHYQTIGSSYITNDIELIAEWVLKEVNWFNKIKSVQE